MGFSCDAMGCEWARIVGWNMVRCRPQFRGQQTWKRNLVVQFEVDVFQYRISAGSARVWSKVLYDKSG